MTGDKRRQAGCEVAEAGAGIRHKKDSEPGEPKLWTWANIIALVGIVAITGLGWTVSAYFPRISQILGKH